MDFEASSYQLQMVVTVDCLLSVAFGAGSPSYAMGKTTGIAKISGIITDAGFSCRIAECVVDLPFGCQTIAERLHAFCFAGELVSPAFVFGCTVRSLLSMQPATARTEPQLGSFVVALHTVTCTWLVALVPSHPPRQFFAKLTALDFLVFALVALEPIGASTGHCTVIRCLAGFTLQHGSRARVGYSLEITLEPIRQLQIRPRRRRRMSSFLHGFGCRGLLVPSHRCL